MQLNSNLSGKAVLVFIFASVKKRSLRNLLIGAGIFIGSQNYLYFQDGNTEVVGQLAPVLTTSPPRLARAHRRRPEKGPKSFTFCSYIFC
jgi:hypothetical protein